MNDDNSVMSVSDAKLTHQLRNDVHVLQSYIELLEMSLPEEVAQKAPIEDYFLTLKKRIKRITETIRSYE